MSQSTLDNYYYTKYSLLPFDDDTLHTDDCQEMLYKHKYELA